MPEVIVKYKSENALKALQDFARYFDMVIEQTDKKAVDKIAPIRFAKNPNPNALSGIWKDNPQTLEQVREKAWGKRR